MRSVREKNKKIQFSVVLNLLIIVTTIGSIVSFFDLNLMDIPYNPMGVQCFRYFTILSNILLALGCVPVIAEDLRILQGKREQLSHRTVIIKFVSTVTAMVTFMTVLCYLGPILAPTSGFFSLYIGGNFFLHFLNPLLSVLTMVLFERGERIKKAEILYCVIPYFLYGLTYLVMVVFVGQENGGWPDFYHLRSEDGSWYFAAIAMTAMVVFLGIVIRKLYQGRKKGKSPIES